MDHRLIAFIQAKLAFITLEHILYWLIAANAIAFVLMVWDKHCAQAGRWRVSESSLLLWSMAGGSIGALAASHIVRHKTRKQPIAGQLRAIPCLQLAAAAALHFFLKSG
ncbi:MAG: DUF1294 domain-containing protein [Sphingopyxis sp.]